MKKLTNGRVWFTGSRREIPRTVYEEDGRFFVKWGGEFVEVTNENPGVVTRGWVTVKQY